MQEDLRSCQLQASLEKVQGLAKAHLCIFCTSVKAEAAHTLFDIKNGGA